VLIGLVPAHQASAADLVEALKAGAREGGGRRSIARGALVAVQAALSVVLLVGAGLFLRSLHNARGVELGFSADRVLTVTLDFTGTGYSSEGSVVLHDELRERLARVPGVEMASVAMTTPFATTLDIDIALPGRDSVPLPATGSPRFNMVSPDYFATMGTRIVRGRAFTEHDRKGSPPVAVVNETMARTLWPGRNPIGECVILRDEEGKPCVEVVGVAQDVRWQDLREETPMQMYLAMAQRVVTFPLRVIFVRTSMEGERRAVLARRIQEEVRALAPRILLAEVKPLAQNLEPELRPWRLGATVFTAFGGLALVLAALGLYSVIAYDVAQRMREMGVRIALGARPRDILRLVVGEGVRVAAVGIALGGVVALAAGRWVGALLFDTSADDPMVIGGVAATLLAVAAAACLVPAWRATRVPPGSALRVE
jgi:predicted permease